MFFTGNERSASEILSDQDQKSKQDDPMILQNLHQIKEIGLETRKHLEKGNIDMLGDLFRTHWEIKKKRSNKISNQHIDECYELAIKKGAIGGKLVGAGGGGFLLLYCNNGYKPRVIEALHGADLKWNGLHFDFDGAKILVDV